MEVPRHLFYFFLIFISLSSAQKIPNRDEELERNFIHPDVVNQTDYFPFPFDPTLPLDTIRPTGPPIPFPFPSQVAACLCGIKRNKNMTLFENVEKENVPLQTGGIVSEVNEFPWVVALVRRSSGQVPEHFCGGTLISSKFIVTAAHCTQNQKVEETEIWLNVHDLLLNTVDAETVKMKASRFIVHPHYRSRYLYNDISLIELSEEVRVEPGLYNQITFTPICLPKNEDFDVMAHGPTGTSAGWGQTSYMGPKSDKLVKISVPLLSNEKCKKDSIPYYENHVTTNMLCAGDLVRGGVDPCPGDSGSPLFVVNERQQHVLIGIVSWGIKCGVRQQPGVYTRVSKYIRWIRAETSRKEGESQVDYGRYCFA